jgi:hypothetical protein
MRWKIPAGVLVTLALLIPAVSAVAQAESSGLHETSSDTDVRVLANQILAAAKADSLTTLPGRLQARLDGTADDLRAFLKTKLQTAWSIDLRIAVNQTMTNAGSNVKAAAQEALDNGTVDASLAYLNDGLYVARALDSGSFKAYADIRELVTIDLDAASDTDVRVLANQILAAAKADLLTTLPGRLQARLDGTADDLRAFLKTKLQTAWSIDLRIAVNQTMTNAGSNVKAAAQEALDNGTVDASLAYLNHGLYLARALDCTS